MEDLSPGHDGWKGTRGVGVNVYGYVIRLNGGDIKELEEIHGIGLKGQTKGVMGLGVAGLEVGDAGINVVGQGGADEKEEVGRIARIGELKGSEEVGRHLDKAGHKLFDGVWDGRGEGEKVGNGGYSTQAEERGRRSSEVRWMSLGLKRSASSLAVIPVRAAWNESVVRQLLDRITE
jgi:hypothetical protein